MPFVMSSWEGRNLRQFCNGYDLHCDLLYFFPLRNDDTQCMYGLCLLNIHSIMIFVVRFFLDIVNISEQVLS